VWERVEFLALFSFVVLSVERIGIVRQKLSRNCTSGVKFERIQVLNGVWCCTQGIGEDLELVCNALVHRLFVLSCVQKAVTKTRRGV
jgi:hypothetical protein